jgi:hypothetical protein
MGEFERRGMFEHDGKGMLRTSWNVPRDDMMRWDDWAGTSWMTEWRMHIWSRDWQSGYWDKG